MGRIRSISMGAALAAVVGLVGVSTANAQAIAEVVLLEQAGALIMPFDNTENHVSFQIVSRHGLGASGSIATHWSYWSDDCRHLIDVIVCLTPGDTKVMDPTKVQGEIQSPNPPANNGIGSITDLTNERGLVTVTAFEAQTGPSGLECNIVDTTPLGTPEIDGGWVIANTSTNAAFGADALGIVDGTTLPDSGFISGFPSAGIFIQTFNPQGLGDSAVIMLTAQEESGNGRFLETEIGPIRDQLPNGSNVCCNVTYTDNLEITTSLPDLCFECVGFNPISDLQASGLDASIIPPNTTIDAPGFIRLNNCESLDGDGLVAPMSDAELPQFLFGIHGQAIGSFGFGIHGKYSSEGF